MFRVSFFTKKKDGVSAEAFRDYWLGEHAEQVKAFASSIGIRRYIKDEALKDHPLTHEGTRSYDTGPLRYDFIDHWFFNDIAQLRAGAAKPEVQDLMRASFASEADWVDVSQTNALMEVDLAQFYPVDSDEIRATTGDPYLKIYYPVRMLPHLTREQAQLHWNACHGAESRQHIKYSVQKKYIQCHAIESTFVNELCTERGYEVDPTFIGHAEGWIDPNQVARDFPEEERAEIVRMTMDDIDLFADKTRGSVFFAQEHYVVDETIITRPDPTVSDLRMPAFFSAVY